MNEQNKNPIDNYRDNDAAGNDRGRANSENQKNAAKAENRAEDGWLPPMPREELPEPTFWPITLALGLTLLLWGIVTSIYISMVGFIIVVLAVRGWVHDIRRDHQKQSVEKYG